MLLLLMSIVLTARCFRPSMHAGIGLLSLSHLLAAAFSVIL